MAELETITLPLELDLERMEASARAIAAAFIAMADNLAETRMLDAQMTEG